MPPPVLFCGSSDRQRRVGRFDRAEIGLEEALGIGLGCVVADALDDVARRGDAGRVERVQRLLPLPRISA